MTPVPRADAITLAHQPYLTSRETVAYLRLPSLNALRQRMKRGSIPMWCWTRMGGRSLRFLRAALDDWLQTNQPSALQLVPGETRQGMQPHAPRRTQTAGQSGEFAIRATRAAHTPTVQRPRSSAHSNSVPQKTLPRKVGSR